MLTAFRKRQGYAVRKEDPIIGHPGSWLPPILIGALACLLVTGGSMLAPGNIHWLAKGDLAQSYLGWAFYRYAPWSWPLGANPLYGAGLHTSIYYSDSIPLLAMLLKPWAAWLPQPFQYFGVWVLACFVLQAWFAWRLLGTVSRHAVVNVLGVLFFVFAPPMLARLGGHMALVGHWTVLAALYLCLRPGRRHQAVWWAVLLALAMMVHAYLFAITGALWLADWVHRYRAMASQPSRRRTLLPELIGVGAIALLAGWLAGLFMVAGQATQAEGFGYYKMNVLAPINGDGWSWLGLNFAQTAGEYEGFNYFGAGGLALLVSAAVVALLRRGQPRERRMPASLLIVAVLLAIAAVTCNIGIGAVQWHLPMPEKWWTKLSHLPLQSTGRLFWATYYIAWVAAMYVLLQSCSLRWQISVLGAALVLQCIDLAPGLVQFQSALTARANSAAHTDLRGDFWDAAGDRYTLLRMLPLSKRDDWEQLAFYASRHHMGMDGVQLARIDMNRFLLQYNAQQAALLGDMLDVHALYLVDDRDVAVARLAVPAQDAALFQLDGKNVLAPEWRAPLPASAVDLRSHATAPPYELPFKSGFAQADAARRLLGQGWNATGEGLLSLADTATVFVPGGHDARQGLHVELALHRANIGRSMASDLEAWFDGKRVGQCHMANDGCRAWAFDLPPDPQGRYFREVVLRPGVPHAQLRITLDAISVR